MTIEKQVLILEEDFPFAMAFVEGAILYLFLFPTPTSLRLVDFISAKASDLYLQNKAKVTFLTFEDSKCEIIPTLDS